MAQFDLTAKMSPHLDPHLVFPMLEFLQDSEVYDKKEVLAGKLQLLESTNMIDYTIQAWKQLNGDKPVPASYEEKRASIKEQWQKHTAACGELTSIIGQPDLVSSLKKDKDFHMAYLKQNHGVKQEHLDALLPFAKFLHSCGQYELAARCLTHFRSLSSDAVKCNAALWGKYAADILTQRWDAAFRDMLKLKESIETKAAGTAAEKMNKRTWLMHWSLFLFANCRNGQSQLIQMFSSDKYMQAIQSAAPHLMRYLVAAVIGSSRRRHTLRDLVRALEHSDDAPTLVATPVDTDANSNDNDNNDAQDKANAAQAFKVIVDGNISNDDPLAAFVRRLYVRLDFEGAHAELARAEQLLTGDFFLASQRAGLLESARLFVFESYCRIHQTIDIKMLAAKLNMDVDAAEQWIVNMIRDAQIDAKIDSENNHILMGKRSSTPHERAIEKTYGLTMRSQVLINNIGQMRKNAVKAK